MKIKTCALLTCIILLLGISGAAWGRTANNDTTSTATPIGPGETVSGSVGPKDELDFYKIVIKPDADVSGTVTMESPQEGTSMRITGERYTIFARRTTEDELKLVYMIPEEGVEPGTYYIRIGFHPGYDYDHEYTLDLDLTIDRGFEIETELRPEAAFMDHDFRVPLLLEPTVPWPSVRGGATHRSWSSYPGPPGAAHEIAAFDIPSDKGLAPGDYTFASLLAGPDDRVYCVGEWKLTAYDISSGYLWEEWVCPISNPCYLDGEGNIYTVNFYQTELQCLDPDGNELWSYTVPSGMHWNQFLGVGKRIYVGRSDGLDLYVDVLDKSGNFIYTAGPLYAAVHGMVEDPNAAAYFQTQYGLYQYDWSGVETWHVDFPHSDDWINLGVRALEPLVGRDHKVWVHSPYRKRVYIYNPNGTLAHTTSYANSPDDEPTAVCYGSNNNLYVAYRGGRLKCYEDWATELWDVQLPGAVGAHDMIMDSDNCIYIHYTSIPTLTALILRHHWASINSDTGAIFFSTAITDMPNKFLSERRGELAIGEDNRLIYLNLDGYIAVYEPLMLRYAPDMRLEKFELRETGG